MSGTVKFATAEAIFAGRMRGNQLMLSSISLGPEEARLMWQSAKMMEITWLDLDDNRLGDAGVKDLAECGYLENVQYLNLNGNGIGDAGVKILAESKCLPQLKRLHLKNNPIQGEGVIALFNSQSLDNLSTFQINDGWTCKKREGWRYKAGVRK